MPEEEKKGVHTAETNNALSDTDFIREQIKQRPLNRRKLLRRTMMTVALAIVFGLVATLTFILLQPVFNRALNPETEQEAEPVVLTEQPVEQEVKPEDLIADDSSIGREEEQSGVMDALEQYTFDAADYGEMIASLKSLAQTGMRSIVTITRHTNETVWSGDAFETSDTASGLLVADNGTRLLILTDRSIVENAEELLVTFFDGTLVTGEVFGTDSATNLAIVSVLRSALTQEQRESMPLAVLGNSQAAQLIGQPVIAIGEPAGIPGSMAYGFVMTNSRMASFADANYTVLSTDIHAASDGSGVLLNMRGEVIGFFSPFLTAYFGDDAPAQLQVYGISAVRRLVEHLSNGKEHVYFGVCGADVPQDVRESEQIPQGAYVTRIEMNSPAMAAGIQSGDVIVGLGEEEVTGYNNFSGLLLNHLPGEEVVVTLMRPAGGEYTEMEFRIVLGSGS